MEKKITLKLKGVPVSLNDCEGCYFAKDGVGCVWLHGDKDYSGEFGCCDYSQEDYKHFIWVIEEAVNEDANNPSSPQNKEIAEKMIIEIDHIAKEADCYDYGLPLFDSDYKEKILKVVTQALDQKDREFKELIEEMIKKSILCGL